MRFIILQLRLFYFLPLLDIIKNLRRLGQLPSPADPGAHAECRKKTAACRSFASLSYSRAVRLDRSRLAI